MVIGFPILKVIAAQQIVVNDHCRNKTEFIPSARPSAVVVTNLAHTSDLDKVCERADFEETNDGTGWVGPSERVCVAMLGRFREETRSKT
jgi:hypothetical protein